MDKKPVYQETQSMLWFHLLLVAIWIAILLGYFYGYGKNPISLPVLIIFTVLFIALFILFYDLKISITEKNISAIFGIGIFRQTMKIDEMDFSSFEKIKLPRIYGIGVRLTPKGVLYNARFGLALRIKSKDKKKTFFVGTKNVDTIKKELTKLR